MAKRHPEEYQGAHKRKRDPVVNHLACLCHSSVPTNRESLNVPQAWAMAAIVEADGCFPGPATSRCTVGRGTPACFAHAEIRICSLDKSYLF